VGRAFLPVVAAVALALGVPSSAGAVELVRFDSCRS